MGCLGRLSSFSETEDGRYLITLDGLIRFAVAEELEMRRGYRRVRGDFAPFRGRLDAGAAAGRRSRATSCSARCARYFAARGFEANWEAIDGCRTTHAGGHALHGLPVRAAEKQALLEAPSRGGPGGCAARAAADRGRIGRG